LEKRKRRRSKLNAIEEKVRNRTMFVTKSGRDH